MAASSYPSRTPDLPDVCVVTHPLAAAGETVSVTADDGDGERTVEVERRLQVLRAADGNPLGLAMESDPVTITTVNGEPVATEGQFLDAVGDAERATGRRPLRSLSRFYIAVPPRTSPYTALIVGFR